MWPSSSRIVRRRSTPSGDSKGAGGLRSRRGSRYPWRMASRLPSPISPPPKLVLFDLDDTLCDYTGARALRLRLAFSLDLDPEVAGASSVARAERDLDRMVDDSLALHPHGADHFPVLFRRHGILAEGAAEAAMRWYREHRFHGLRLFDDAVSTLAAVRQAGTGAGVQRIGLVTNGPAEVQRAKLELLGVTSLVDFAIVSEEFGAWKPDPSIFREALRLGDATAAEAVFVGDSAEHDMAGAHAAGIRSIWVNRTGRPWSTGAPSPDYEIPDLRSLLPLLGVHPDASDDGRD